jgi:5-methylcytosine-specific restriction endonuclease McrA
MGQHKRAVGGDQVMPRDYRTDEAAAYRKLYKTKQWQLLRVTILTRDGFRCQHKGCGTLLKQGRSGDRSAVVHHKSPHKGDMELFFDPDNLTSVCKRCHDGDIQSIEANGFDTTIGPDGWPVDPAHPFLSGK